MQLKAFGMVLLVSSNSSGGVSTSEATTIAKENTGSYPPVADISARDAIASPVEGKRVVVLDADGSGTVKEYEYNGSAWVEVVAGDGYADPDIVYYELTPEYSDTLSGYVDHLERIDALSQRLADEFIAAGQTGKPCIIRLQGKNYGVVKGRKPLATRRNIFIDGIRYATSFTVNFDAPYTQEFTMLRAEEWRDVGNDALHGARLYFSGDIVDQVLATGKRITYADVAARDAADTSTLRYGDQAIIGGATHSTWDGNSWNTYSRLTESSGSYTGYARPNLDYFMPVMAIKNASDNYGSDEYIPQLVEHRYRVGHAKYNSGANETEVIFGGVPALFDYAKTNLVFEHFVPPCLLSNPIGGSDGGDLGGANEVNRAGFTNIRFDWQTRKGTSTGNKYATTGLFQSWETGSNGQWENDFHYLDSHGHDEGLLSWGSRNGAGSDNFQFNGISRHSFRQNAASMCVNIGIYGQAGQNKFDFGYNWREANLIASDTSNYWLGIGYDIGVHPALQTINNAGPLGVWIRDDSVQQKYIAYRIYGGKAFIFTNYIEDCYIHADVRGMTTINKGIANFYASHTGGNVGSTPFVSAGATAGQRTKFAYRKRSGAHFIANDNAHIGVFGFECIGAIDYLYECDETSSFYADRKQRNGGDTFFTNMSKGGTKSLAVTSNRLSLKDHKYAELSNSSVIHEIFSATTAGDSHLLNVTGVNGAIFQRPPRVAYGTVTLSKGDATIALTSVTMADDDAAFDNASTPDYNNINLSYIHIDGLQNYELVRGQGVGQVFRLDRAFSGASGTYSVNFYKYRNNFKCYGGIDAGTATYPQGTLLHIAVTDINPASFSGQTPAIDYEVRPILSDTSKSYKVRFEGSVTATALRYFSLSLPADTIIKKIKFIAGAGSGTLQVRINDVAVTTASAMTLSTSIQTVTPTGLNYGAKGLKVDALITSPSGLSNVDVEIET